MNEKGVGKVYKKLIKVLIHQNENVFSKLCSGELKSKEYNTNLKFLSVSSTYAVPDPPASALVPP